MEMRRSLAPRVAHHERPWPSWRGAVTRKAVITDDLRSVLLPESSGMLTIECRLLSRALSESVSKGQRRVGLNLNSVYSLGFRSFGSDERCAAYIRTLEQAHDAQAQERLTHIRGGAVERLGEISEFR